MIKLVLQIIGFYILYKLVVDFIIPVYKTTRQLKSKMGEMQQKMEEQQRSNNFQAPKPEPQKQDNNREYIDYEEIR